MRTPNPCTLGPKHSWTWTHNTKITQATTRVVRLSLRGAYSCACGEKKLGQPNHNGADLRGVIGDGTFVASTTHKQPEPDRSAAKALIAVNLAAPAMARDDGITINGKSPWKPSVSATARIKDPQMPPSVCPCCSGGDIVCLHQDDMGGQSRGVWPWLFVCRTPGCRATAALIPFTNIPAGPLMTAAMRRAAHQG